MPSALAWTTSELAGAPSAATGSSSPRNAAAIRAPTVRAAFSPCPPPPVPRTGGPACAPCPSPVAPPLGRCFQPPSAAHSPAPPRCFAAPRFTARVHRARQRPTAPTSRPAPWLPCGSLARPAPASSPLRGASVRGVHEARSVLRSSNLSAARLLIGERSLFIRNDMQAERSLVFGLSAASVRVLTGRSERRRVDRQQKPSRKNQIAVVRGHRLPRTVPLRPLP